MALAGGLAANGVLAGAPAGTGRVVARTANAGVAAINGTQTTLSYTVPNDGQLHRVGATSVIVVGTAETGGSWRVAFTINAVAQTTTIHAAGLGAGTVGVAETAVMCDAGSTVSIQQGSALTAGTATVYQSLMADG